MFKNARIIGTGADAMLYHKQEAQRGALDFVMSSSSLRNFAICPSKWIFGWELPPSASLEYGSLFDTLVLTPGQFEKKYVVAPLMYEAKGMECPECKSVTDSQKCSKCKKDRIEIKVSKDWNYQAKYCSDWKAAKIAAGKEITTTFDVVDTQAAMKRLHADEQIKAFLDGCDRQVWIEAEWHDEATGLVIKVKCLIDLAGKEDGPFAKRLGDLKTTKNAAPIAWAKWADFAGYSIQAAWNTDLFVAATSREITDFCFVLSENSAPWEPGRRYMSQDLDNPGMDEGSIASGRRQYRKMIEGYCQCVKTGKWPGFDDTDEASASGWTLVSPDPYAEQRRMFAPKFRYGMVEPVEPAEEQEPDPDLIP